MKAVILVGGKGTRLRPITYEIPKPLLPVHKKPIVNHLVEFLFRHGVDDVILLASRDHREDFERWQKAWRDEVPFSHITIHYEEAPRGTFGGLEPLQSQLREDFLLLNGDALKEFPLKEFQAFHARQGSVATISLAEVDEPHLYGVPVVTGNRIVDFLEKPTASSSRFVSSGFYLFRPTVFSYADFSREVVMVEKDLFPRLAREGQLSAFHVPAVRWYDCGTLERWERAMREWPRS